MRRIRSERVIESKHVDGGMTKTTPEKSKARENNESERGALSAIDDGIHVATTRSRDAGSVTRAEADVAFGPPAAQLCGLIR